MKGKANGGTDKEAEAKASPANDCEATPMGWLPAFPDQDGDHAFSGETVGEVRVLGWDSQRQEWRGDLGGSIPPVSRYLGAIVPTPALDAAFARAQKRMGEQCLEVVRHERCNFPANPSIQTEASAIAYRACQRIFESIEALVASPAPGCGFGPKQPGALPGTKNDQTCQTGEKLMSDEDATALGSVALTAILARVLHAGASRPIVSLLSDGTISTTAGAFQPGDYVLTVPCGVGIKARPESDLAARFPDAKGFEAGADVADVVILGAFSADQKEDAIAAQAAYSEMLDMREVTPSAVSGWLNRIALPDGFDMNPFISAAFLRQRKQVAKKRRRTGA